MALYVTVQEFKDAPTGIDTTTLDQAFQGNPAAQDMQLLNILRRASNWVNNIVQKDTLEATTFTETKMVHVGRDGRLDVFVKNSPIISLNSISYRLNPSLTFTPIDLTNVQVYDSWFAIYQLDPTYANLSLVQQIGYFWYFSPYQRQVITKYPVTVQYTYTAGYFNSTLAANAAQGATTITVKNATGLSPGSTFTIYDSANQEDCTVAAVNGNTITLTSGLQNAHNAGVGCSAIPDAVKQATILYAAYLIKERGSMAITTNEIVASGTEMSYNRSSDLEIAKELLAPYRSVVVN